jgi:hypothetical protein
MRRTERWELFDLNITINNLFIHGFIIWVAREMGRGMFLPGTTTKIYSLYPGEMEVIPFPYMYSFLTRALYKPPEVFPSGGDDVADFAAAYFFKIGASILIYIYYREVMRMKFELSPLNWIRAIGTFFFIMGILYFIIPFIPGVYEVPGPPTYPFTFERPANDFFTLPFWLVIVAIINVIYYFTRVPLVVTQEIYTNEEV